MVALPAGGGHDLAPQHGGDLLLVTTDSGVWQFDRAAKRFAPFAPLEHVPNVKSIDRHARTGRIVYVAAEHGERAKRLRFVEPAGELRLDFEVYKTRWVSSAQR